MDAANAITDCTLGQLPPPPRGANVIPGYTPPLDRWLNAVHVLGVRGVAGWQRWVAT